MEGAVHQETLEQTTPTFLLSYISAGVDILQNYGWYILGASLLCLYAWSKIKPHVYKWLKDREDRQFAAKYHKDPDLIYKRQDAIETARRRLEEKYAAEAAKAAEKRKELEEKKRQEWLRRQEGTSHPGHRLNEGLDQDSHNNATDENASRKKPTGLRSDYNPLMGSGSRGYRPPRRSCCPSGGCG
ncbi:selenoprotein S-like [Schistocerca nitens]|uniref:selenoprotein S-like n=1 Tax=Schistocerca nitens TaxID=7011 RepID=UPI002119540B|nr:selenoprotein S-like [Schistocerca nitens]